MGFEHMRGKTYRQDCRYTFFQDCTVALQASRMKERKKKRKEEREEREKRERKKGLLYRILNLLRPPRPVLVKK